MKHCPRCAADVHPVSVLSVGGGVCLACPSCEGEFKGEAFEEVSIQADPKAERKVFPAAPAPIQTVKLAGPSTEAATLLEQVRARLAAIDVELERAASLKAERRTLASMLRAAEKNR